MGLRHSDARLDEHFYRGRDEDATQFTDANLAQYKAVIFLNTSGDVLNTNQQGRFNASSRPVMAGWNPRGGRHPAHLGLVWRLGGDLLCEPSGDCPTSHGESR